MTNSSSSFNTRIGDYGPIPATVGSALTVVFMMLPWMKIPALGQAASLLIGTSELVKSDYSILDLMGYVGPAMSDTSNSDGAKGALIGFMVLWVVGIALMAYGAIRNWNRGDSLPLRVGAGVVALTAVTWCGVITWVSGELSKQVGGLQMISLTPWPIASIFEAVASALLAGSARTAGGGTWAPDVRLGGQGGGQVNGQGGYQGNGQASTQGGYQGGGQVGVQGGYQGGGQMGGYGVVPPAQPQEFVDASCVCPSCGSTVVVQVPNSNCMVDITCSYCHTTFPMEVQPL